MSTLKKDTSILQSVQNGLKIIRLFSVEKPIWGITEMSKELELNKSTVSRLVNDLIEEGFLQKKKNKYCLGLSLLCLSGVITSNLEIQREAKDTLQELVDKVEETAHLCILEGVHITYLQKVECKHPVRLMSHIGRNNPASCTSSGKVLLANQKDSVIENVIQAGLPKMGPNSVTDPKEFLHQLRVVKEQNYSVCIDELHDDIVSIAAPIYDYTGEVVAAISIAGPSQRIKTDHIPLYIDTVKNAGNEISAKLGYIESIF